MIGKLGEGGLSCLRYHQQVLSCKITCLPKPLVLLNTMKMVSFKILHVSLSEQNIHQNPIGKGWEETDSHTFGTCYTQSEYKKSEMMLSANR